MNAKRARTLGELLAALSDLLFSLDSRLWRTLIGLIRRPVVTNRLYLIQGNDLLHPLKLLFGLCTLSVVVWALVPWAPNFMDGLAEAQPEVVEELRQMLESDGVHWPHFVDTANQRMSLLNAPFVLLVSLPVMLYFKLLKRSRPFVDHAILALNAFNVYLIFHILSAPLYALQLGVTLTGLLPLLLVLVPYLALILVKFYARSRWHAVFGTLGLLIIFAVSYSAAAYAVLFVGGAWAGWSVTSG